MIASSFPGVRVPYTVTMPTRPVGDTTALCRPAPTGMKRMLSARRSMNDVPGLLVATSP
jgi:hypothetical protein